MRIILFFLFITSSLFALYCPEPVEPGLSTASACQARDQIHKDVTYSLKQMDADIRKVSKDESIFCKISPKLFNCKKSKAVLKQLKELQFQLSNLRKYIEEALATPSPVKEQNEIRKKIRIFRSNRRLLRDDYGMSIKKREGLTAKHKYTRERQQ